MEPLMRDHPYCQTTPHETTPHEITAHQTTPHKTTPLIRPPCLSDNCTPQIVRLPCLSNHPVRPPLMRPPCLSDHPSSDHHAHQTIPHEITLLVRPPLTRPPLLLYYLHETTILVSPPLGRPSLSSDHPSFKINADHPEDTTSTGYRVRLRLYVREWCVAAHCVFVLQKGLHCARAIRSYIAA